MRRLVFCFLYLLNTVFVFAQADSINFSKAKWKTSHLAPGINLKQAWFKDSSLFKADEHISVLEVKPRRKNKFSIALERKIKRTASDFGRQNHAVAAINGTFFDVKNGGSVDFIRAHGQIINENQLLKDSIRARHQRAALVIKDGRLHIDKWDGSSSWEKSLDGEDVMLTGPLLLYNGKTAELDTGSFNRLRHPRSAIAVTGDKDILLITVDGRNANSAGMSLYELAEMLRWLHCRDGVNLDGGGSTTLWEKKDGVVNYPSDNKKWDHEGERKVANVVLVKRN